MCRSASFVIPPRLGLAGKIHRAPEPRTQERHSRLTRDHVEKVEAALDLIARSSTFGQVVLVVEKGRIAAIEATSSVRYRDLLEGSPSATDTDN